MKPRSPIAGQLAVKSRTIVTHSDNYEMLLIRAGHHLWRLYKQAQKNHSITDEAIYESALESVWAAKEEYRKPFRERNKANHKASGERLRKKADAARV